MITASHPSVQRLRQQMEQALHNEKVDDVLTMAVSRQMLLRVTFKIAPNGGVHFQFQLEDSNGRG